MPTRSVGPGTVKKNIERESQHYFVRHKTHRFVQELSKLDDRTIGSYLDGLLEQEARRRLPAAKVEAIIAESERKEAERRQQAEQMLQQREEQAQAVS